MTFPRPHEDAPILPVLLGAASSLPPAPRARSRDGCHLAPETWPPGGPSLPPRVSTEVTQSLRQGHVLIHSTTHPGTGAAATGSRDPTPPAQSQPLGPARASRPPGRTKPTLTNPLPASPVSHFHRTQCPAQPRSLQELSPSPPAVGLAGPASGRPDDGLDGKKNTSLHLKTWPIYLN